jgi:hypothetical protein
MTEPTFGLSQLRPMMTRPGILAENMLQARQISPIMGWSMAFWFSLRNSSSRSPKCVIRYRPPVAYCSPLSRTLTKLANVRAASESAAGG